MSASVSCVYSSCACNKSPRCLDWGNNNLICYGACNAVHLFTHEKLSGGQLKQTLLGHKKLVTSVHWISKPNRGSEHELISTSADHTAVIWTSQNSEFYLSHVLEGHSSIVKTAASLYIKCKDDQCLIVATSSADSSVIIWERCNGQVEKKQSIPLHSGFALDLKFALLEDEDVVLIVGSDDSKIYLYTQGDQSNFISTVSLKGHEDWIQGLDITVEENGSLMLASASQDNHIRLWKVSSKCAANYSQHPGLKVDETSLVTQKGHNYYVTLESVLSSHENWIYSVRWKLKQYSENVQQQLLSASMDKTMIVWEQDTSSKIWLEKIRVGEVGGNTLGFYGGLFSPSGETIVAHGFHGAIHLWQHNQELDSWQPGISFGGHYDAIQDIDWDPSGDFVLSCSHDQTTRLHAPYLTDSSQNNWHEIARPQVHGYDMVCLAMLDRYKFVSAGDEKVLRSFEAPRSFAENLEKLCKIDVSSYVKESLPEGATVPALGISNKAVFQEDLKIQSENKQKHPKDQYPDVYYTPTTLQAPPTEEMLLQNTLWPEIQKLYGHPYEVFTVAVNNSKTIVASACKASKVEHAAIILWNTETWKEIGQLLFHALTVTQLAFSPDDRYLLSVSRDRMWALYERFPEESPPYRKIANLDKKSGVHARIIWTCAWTFDSSFFVTGSRDKKVAIWRKDTNSTFSLSSKPLEVADSATAVSVAPCLTADERYIVAVGLENGCIVICTWAASFDWNVLQKLEQNIAHHLCINRLRFSPVVGKACRKTKNSDIVQLASCSSDHSVRIFNIVINKLMCK